MDALDKLLPKGSTESRTLADIILEKIEASEAAKTNAGPKGPQIVRKGKPSYFDSYSNCVFNGSRQRMELSIPLRVLTRKL